MFLLFSLLANVKVSTNQFGSWPPNNSMRASTSESEAFCAGKTKKAFQHYSLAEQISSRPSWLPASVNPPRCCSWAVVMNNDPRNLFAGHDDVMMSSLLRHPIGHFCEMSSLDMNWILELMPKLCCLGSQWPWLWLPQSNQFILESNSILKS